MTLIENAKNAPAPDIKSSRKKTYKLHKTALMLRSNCDNCCIAKIKCSGGLPCVLCSRRGTKCHYSLKKKPGPRSKSSAPEVSQSINSSAFSDFNIHQMNPPHGTVPISSSQQLSIFEQTLYQSIANGLSPQGQTVQRSIQPAQENKNETNINSALVPALWIPDSASMNYNSIEMNKSSSLHSTQRMEINTDPVLKSMVDQARISPLVRRENIYPAFDQFDQLADPSSNGFNWWDILEADLSDVTPTYHGNRSRAKLQHDINEGGSRRCSVTSGDSDGSFSSGNSVTTSTISTDSVIHYHQPLYPFMSANSSRHPVEQKLSVSDWEQLLLESFEDSAEQSALSLLDSKQMREMLTLPIGERLFDIFGSPGLQSFPL